MDRSGAGQDLARNSPCSGVTTGAGWQDLTARCEGSSARTAHLISAVYNEYGNTVIYENSESA